MNSKFKNELNFVTLEKCAKILEHPMRQTISVKLTYSTSLKNDCTLMVVNDQNEKTYPLGKDCTVKVFSTIDKNGRENFYYSVSFEVSMLQNYYNIKQEIYTNFYKYKKACMMFNRSLKIEKYKKDNNILFKSHFPGTWDIWRENNNQLPPPPKQITIDF
jgi:hypothetical protein